MVASTIPNELIEKGLIEQGTRPEEKVTKRWSSLTNMYARWALGAAFLSSVADRFGLWGNYGQKNVSWGDFGHFTQYAAMVNSFLPARVIPSVAWIATIAETVFGLALIMGIYRRIVAIGSAGLLFLFALAMSISFGVKSAIDYSVFPASAAALLLFVASQNIAGTIGTAKSAD